MTGIAFWLAVAASALMLLGIFVPSAVFAMQMVAATGSRPRPSESPATEAPTIAVLMPAHDEAQGIEAFLRPLIAQLRACDRVVVIADNCSDATAEVAAACGAQVTVRHNRDLRGKGHALDHGMRYLQAAPPEVVIILDADCQTGPGALQTLAREAVSLQRPVQAAYLMTSAPGADLRLRVSEFAWRVRNLLRPRAMHRLGLPCQLMGSGMAFPYCQLSAMQLASSHLAEDLQLGLALAARGHAPVFCEAALVTSEAAGSSSVAYAQRTRWEHGHLGSMKAIPGLLMRSFKLRTVGLLAMALDLGVPPLALLFTLTVGGSVAALALWGVSGLSAPLWVSGGALSLLLLGLVIAWVLAGRDLVSASELLRLPGYVLWKLPLYARYLFDRQVDWIRTPRR